MNEIEKCIRCKEEEHETGSIMPSQYCEKCRLLEAEEAREEDYKTT